VLEPKLQRIAETRAGARGEREPRMPHADRAGLRRTGSTARGVHPVELLDASYAAARRRADSRVGRADGVAGKSPAAGTFALRSVCLSRRADAERK
jgi:hypothetical protein